MSENEDKVKKATERIVSEMENDERYKTFFAPYRADSVKSFISSYARQKAHMEVCGNIGYNNEQSYLEDWLQCAWKCLEEIQHKKLFDLSCQWQAEEKRGLPKVETSNDFVVIGESILDYEGVSPVSDEDLNFYLRYLREEKNVLGYYAHKESYQRYDEIREQFEEHQNTGIAYYDFHNKHTGNDGLLTLKAIRIEKENAYIQIAANKRSKNVPKPPLIKVKPNIYGLSEYRLTFAKKFNDRKMIAFLESQEDFKNNQQDEDKRWAANYLRFLSSATLPIRINESWLDALYETAIGHKQDKVIELLPNIYDEYVMKKSNEIPIAAKDEYNLETFDFYRSMILEGREIKGEPKNLDF